MNDKSVRYSVSKGKAFTISDYSKPVYGENVVHSGGKYAREWNPKRSKLAAALIKGFSHLPFTSDSKILYLGASSGTTVSHISDISITGKIYAVEKAIEPFSKLLFLAEQRRNIYPILDDANSPERYKFFVDNVNVMYQDISQRNQVQIFNENVNAFPGVNSAILILKINAISSKGKEHEILETNLRMIPHFKILDIIDLRPYSKANYFVFMQRIR
ncbi:MAG: fibrillarin-like rRNA/tRNA 2'-O-methyltransferase [Thermoplasmatales archaeon]|nr:fibrillarin-like rRNA/tRNA 2'-O-methyltransferase [Thermoplasmatales archaeon]MCW6170877.1 fibrillarin-like rRNA/tRNA 2'-O-methyltransferase [Thermoplasmatales archaeon]